MTIFLAYFIMLGPKKQTKKNLPKKFNSDGDGDGDGLIGKNTLNLKII
jgi:hypothetical protein